MCLRQRGEVRGLELSEKEGRGRRGQEGHETTLQMIPILVDSALYFQILSKAGPRFYMLPFVLSTLPCAWQTFRKYLRHED